jgi:hypothetical protein
MLRTACAVAVVCTLASLAGCVAHETYGNAEDPASGHAVVEGYWHYVFLYDEEMHVVSVDGTRPGSRSGWPYAYSVGLPAGRHWLQLAILRNSGEIARCAFEWKFDAGHRYKLTRLRHEQFLLAHPASSPYRASIAMEVTAPAGATRRLSVPGVCATAALCRQDADCSGDLSCQIDSGFDFGTCRPRHRP